MGADGASDTDLSPNRRRAEHTLRAALRLLGLAPDRGWVKSGAWAAAVGVVCDQLDAAAAAADPTPEG